MGKREKKNKSTEVADSNPDQNIHDDKNEDLGANLNEYDTPDETKTSITNKRVLDDNEDDSDTEVPTKKPKKKKKTHMPIEETKSSKKNMKSIRQMKKERHAQRQAEAAAQAKDQLKSQCLNYLSQWKHNRQNWKFMKAKQVWLNKNKFSKVLVPETSWPLLLEYFESAQGNIRKTLLDDANKIIKQMDEWTESQDNNEDNGELEETTATKPDDVIYNRARSLIQCLEE